MRLSDADRDLFYRLLWHLLFFAAEQLEYTPRIASPEALSQLDGENWQRLRDSLYEHPDLFDTLVSRNPFGFTADELAIVRSWKRFLRGKFFVWRYLRKHTVFLDGENDAVVYGVVAPNKPFELMLGPHLPVAIEAVLLPFKDKIVYDGLFASYPVRFGPNVRRMLNETYRKAKAGGRIITSLCDPASPRASSRAGATESDDLAAFKFSYWRGFTKRLPYRLSTLKSVTDADVPPDRLRDLVVSIRKERLLDLPTRIGIAEGFDPIQVDVLEFELAGRKKHIEALNRGGSLFYLEDPSELQRFHRFIYAVEQALPEEFSGSHPA